VIFVADHGEELMQRSEHMQHEFQLYGELVHVPFVVVHPGAQVTRQRVAANVSLVDVLPTLRGILGAPPSPEDAGRSLVPFYTELAVPSNERPVFAMRERLEVLGGQSKHAVIHGDDKVILTRNETGEHVELYDLARDWAELENLAEHTDERVNELVGMWRAFASSAPVYAGEKTRVRLSPEEVGKLEELGYTEGAPEDEDDMKPPLDGR
jgi:arylsulfatase A-like enzyme